MASKSIFESDGPVQLGQRATESAHRKIELQSPADLTYLIANVSRAAREKIEKHLPPDAAQSDDGDVRRKVDELVDNYVRDTFALAKDNISVNGMDTREMEAELAKAQEGEELEPFDTKLAQRIQSLSEQIEQHTLYLANMRRRGPQETAERFLSSYDAQTKADAARLTADEEARLTAAKATRLDGGEVRRIDEVRETWEQGTRDLAALKTGLGGTVVRLDRAQKAVAVVEEP